MLPRAVAAYIERDITSYVHHLFSKKHIIIIHAHTSEGRHVDITVIVLGSV